MVASGLFRTLLKDSNNIDIYHSHLPRTFQENIAVLVLVLKNFFKKKKKISHNFT